MPGDKHFNFLKIKNYIKMLQNEKTPSFSRTFLLIVVLTNVLILKTAFINNPDFYWALPFSISLLIFAIYYKRIVSKKEAREREIWKKEIENDVIGRNGDDIVVLPRKMNGDELTVLFGNSHCAQPYLSSIICPESVHADHNINRMPGRIVFSEDNIAAHDMLERLNNNLFVNDSIWSIGPGCRDHNLKFNAKSFRENAASPKVKMIELKVPRFNHQNTISTDNNSHTISVHNSSYADRSFENSCEHTAFSNAESMAIFLDSLRQLSGKKPIGIRLYITDKKSFHEICYAFCKTAIVPDFITIQDCDKENSFPSDSKYSGMPLYEALLFVSKTLDTYGLNEKIKIIAAAEIYSPFDVLRLFALGADAVSFQNHVTRSDGHYESDNMQSTEFSRRSMEQLRTEILGSTMNIMQAWGYKNTGDITLATFFRNLDPLYSKGFYRKHDHKIANNSEKRSFSIVGKGFHEKNTSSEVIYN